MKFASWRRCEPKIEAINCALWTRQCAQQLLTNNANTSTRIYASDWIVREEKQSRESWWVRFDVHIKWSLRFFFFSSSLTISSIRTYFVYDLIRVWNTRDVCYDFGTRTNQAYDYNFQRIQTNNIIIRNGASKIKFIQLIWTNERFRLPHVRSNHFQLYFWIPSSNNK